MLSSALVEVLSEYSAKVKPAKTNEIENEDGDLRYYDILIERLQREIEMKKKDKFLRGKKLNELIINGEISFFVSLIFPVISHEQE